MENNKSILVKILLALVSIMIAVQGWIMVEIRTTRNLAHEVDKHLAELSVRVEYLNIVPPSETEIDNLAELMEMIEVLKSRKP